MSEEQEQFQGDSTWLLLQSTPRASCVIDYPRKEPIKGIPIGKIRVQLLAQDQQHLAQIFAAQFTNEAMGKLEIRDGSAWDEMYQSFLNLEIVQRSCFSEEIYQEKGQFKLFFPPVKLMKMIMTDDELSYLVKAYLTLQQTKGAIRDLIKGEDLRFWSFMIQSQPEQALSSLTHSGMSDLLIAMSEKLESLENAMLEELNQ